MTGALEHFFRCGPRLVILPYNPALPGNIVIDVRHFGCYPTCACVPARQGWTPFNLDPLAYKAVCLDCGAPYRVPMPAPCGKPLDSREHRLRCVEPAFHDGPCSHRNLTHPVDCRCERCYWPV